MVELRSTQWSEPLNVSRSMYAPDTALGRGSHRWSMNVVGQRNSVSAMFRWSNGGPVTSRSGVIVVEQEMRGV